jgi:hypothetical protein
MAKPDLDTIYRNFWLPAPEDADGDSAIFGPFATGEDTPGPYSG